MLSSDANFTLDVWQRCSWKTIDHITFNSVSVLTNIATEGVAEQSSTYSPIYEAHHAIDGILLTDVRDNVSRAQCAITDKTENESWWRVDLMKNTAVIGVIITTRKNWGKINSFGFLLNLLNSTKLYLHSAEEGLSCLMKIILLRYKKSAC